MEKQSYLNMFCYGASVSNEVRYDRLMEAYLIYHQAR